MMRHEFPTNASGVYAVYRMVHQMTALNLICPLPHIQKQNNKWPKVASHLKTTEYLRIDS